MVDGARTELRATLECRQCGAPHEPRLASCGFCRAPLASLRCGHCYLLNHPSLERCLGCGEQLGLEPLPVAQNQPCPNCGLALVAYEDESRGLWDCASCRAQFVSHPMLTSLIEGRRQFARPSAVKPRPLPLNRQIQYRRCPICLEWMQRRNFAATSGVVVDVCAQHGVWFDEWELQQVLAYVEAGGLAASRRSTLGLPEPLSDEEKRRSAQAVAEALSRSRDAPKAPSTAPSEGWEVGLETVFSLIQRWLRVRS